MSLRSVGFLVAGLGNPGERYRDTRHNLGHLVIDRLAQNLDITINEFPPTSSFIRAEFGRARIDEEEVILAKPLTFMNLSGKSIKALLDFFNLSPSRLIVVHDDLDLSLGVVRIKAGGGTGGHRGLDSIIVHLKTDEFTRVRIGIGRPPGRQDPAKYVLNPFTERQWDIIDPAIDRAVAAVLAIIRWGVERAMSEYNRS
ncbi:MAG: aminoacyl-tRNA hydrolase [Actinomycetota bacterium]|nr:aminoacyl-tRNA hydrolase [Actinomycetota bacterium]MDI6822579.1 aminoacyl-tRNA hydrolase [Actinomycetota bacterium]